MDIEAQSYTVACTIPSSDVSSSRAVIAAAGPGVGMIVLGDHQRLSFAGRLLVDSHALAAWRDIKWASRCSRLVTGHATSNSVTSRSQCGSPGAGADRGNTPPDTAPGTWGDIWPWHPACHCTDASYSDRQAPAEQRAYAPSDPAPYSPNQYPMRCLFLVSKQMSHHLQRCLSYLQCPHHLGQVLDLRS